MSDMTAAQRELGAKATVPELTESLIRLLRYTVPEKPEHRKDVAFALGIDERRLRSIRDHAERSADFPIGVQNGYTRLWERSDVAREIKWRRAMRMAYRHLIGKARPKQTAFFIVARSERADWQRMQDDERHAEQLSL